MSPVLLVCLILVIMVIAGLFVLAVIIGLLCMIVSYIYGLWR